MSPPSPPFTASPIYTTEENLMESRSFGERVCLQDTLILKACSLAMKAHNSPPPTFLLDKTDSSHAVFAFPGSWSVNDWFTGKSFGESKIDRTLFPSLRSIGGDETAAVNEAFLQQFKLVLSNSNLHDEVAKAQAENKQVVFTGHSSGGPVAILATIWLLEQHRHRNYTQHPPSCVTFGSPLVGDQIFGHAIRRENWSHRFIHFVTRYDIVPRISLAPLSSIEQILPAILCLFNPYFRQETVARSQEAAVFFTTVMRSASSLASHAACSYMGSTNLLLQSLTSFVKLSPYRPFGNVIFCTASGKMVTVKNPDAVLQMFFHCLQLSPEEDIADVAFVSLQEHLAYELGLQASLQRQEVVYLDDLEHIPLSTNVTDNDQMRLIYIALHDLGLSTKARICLRAAGELEKQTLGNQAKIDCNFGKIEEALNMLQGYRAKCELLEVGYYDAFKFQRKADDFNANVKRLELAGMWDEIVEMLRRNELPDDFEVRRRWVELGTKYRRLVEPLDIANYYRHSKNDDTGPYLIKGRPRRYGFTQRWLEHARGEAPNSCLESCFWAEVEELCNGGGANRRNFQEVKERVLKLENEIEKWVSRGEISKDVFLEESTFIKWWLTLPPEHRAWSCLAPLIDQEGRNIPRLN